MPHVDHAVDPGAFLYHGLLRGKAIRRDAHAQCLSFLLQLCDGVLQSFQLDVPWPQVQYLTNHVVGRFGVEFLGVPDTVLSAR